MTTILETHRLILRRIEPSDAAFLVTLMNEPAYHQNIGDRGVRTIELAKNFISDNFIKSYEKNGFGLFVVAMKQTQEAIGICGLIKRDSMADVDVGFALLSNFHRQGYALESVIATLAYAKEKIGLKRVVAITKMENPASIRLLEKAGLKFEKIIKLPELEHENRLFTIDLI